MSDCIFRSETASVPRVWPATGLPSSAAPDDSPRVRAGRLPAMPPGMPSCDASHVIDVTSDAQLARRVVALTQAGLPLVADPWSWLGRQLGIAPDAVLALLSRMQASGAIRRIAAIPDHYRLGYRHNGMTVWDVDDTQIDALGRCVGNLPYVSHCYRRPRRDGWAYNLFAMVHGRSADDIQHYRLCLRILLGDASRADDMLVSSRILKKTGLRIARQATDTIAPDLTVAASAAVERGATPGEQP